MFYNIKSIQESKLITAAAAGDLCSLEVIMSTYGNFININSMNAEEQTALHMACENNRREAVVYLVEHGADVNALGLGDSTPLHTAVLFSDISTITYLLKKGANPNQKNKDLDFPIDYAEREGKVEVATCMRNFGLLSLNYGKRS